MSAGLPKIDLLPGWDCYDWRNAKTILQYGHPQEWADIVDVLGHFSLDKEALAAKGGRKSPISSAIDGQFYYRDWKETKFETAVLVDGQQSDSPTHKVDCFKGKIALEVEWNNKDPFYDRDLNNFRLLYDLRVADVGVIVTRSTALVKWMAAGYLDLGRETAGTGSSTTHFEKLEPRILGGGAGGCPVLVFAMTPALIV
ncbi:MULTISPECIES: BglII/BstYI family type II restriction endonuclease [Agrobacterium]|uniref:BglII/BstYI family type II restriction endonuclease n=1 Tax=Agrobacterium TaxID=357 RepID=UPI00098F32FC|nr:MULTISPECIES: BglII/BstYI family type II restriction endonuclease [Agrobacterium]MBW9071572.1 restriction endonuclease [Agrobacterium deltaense]OOO36076.1 restriction endonuclease [Agrobacterium sp. YIC 4121]CUX16487.1 Restriction endonuclease BglII [Agrobacterium deltaense RV3]